MREPESCAFRVFEDAAKRVRLDIPSGDHDIDQARSALLSFFKEMQNELAKGRFFAGALSYEAGCLLQEGRYSSLNWSIPDSMPLVHGGFFDTFRLEDGPSGSDKKHQGCLPAGVVLHRTVRQNRGAYRRNVNSIVEAIRRGEVYQANYTFPVDFSFSGDPDELFEALFLEQPSSLAAELVDEELCLLSLSPELLFEIQPSIEPLTGPVLCCRPMKGTARRTGDAIEDEAALLYLTASVKERAENSMIVDLVRNDLGRICDFRTVRVMDVFRIEELPSLFQMTTGVRGSLRSGTSLAELFSALLPCGSVTGAPKLAALSLLQKLESGPRGFYTGAMGWMSATTARWNVPIRTIVLNRETESNPASPGPGSRDLLLSNSRSDVLWRGRIQVGSGITVDSIPAKEYRECLDKLRFFSKATQLPPDFFLYETLLFRKGEFHLVGEHLSRLSISAAAFGLPFVENHLIDRLNRLGGRLRSLTGSGGVRVHMRLTLAGGLIFRLHPLSLPRGNRTLTFSISRSGSVKSTDVLFRHKTSAARKFFDEERSAWIGAAGEGARVPDEILLTNETGEITEGTFTNVFARIDGCWCTPPAAAGLLPGIQRGRFLRSGFAVERRILPSDIVRAECIALVNSVRGICRGVPV